MARMNPTERAEARAGLRRRLLNQPPTPPAAVEVSRLMGEALHEGFDRALEGGRQLVQQVGVATDKVKEGFRKVKKFMGGY